MKIINQIFSITLKYKKTIIVIVLILVLFNIFRSLFFNGNSIFNKNKSEIITRENLGIVKIVPKTVDDTLSVLGEITFKEKVTISSKVNGRLEEIFISEGKIVEKDEPIAQIEKLPFELNLKELENELEISKKSYELAYEKYKNSIKSVDAQIQTIEKSKLTLREKQVQFENANRTYNNKKELFDIQAVSSSEYETAKMQYETSHSQLEQSKRDLEIQKIGYSDSDIRQAGYRIPSSPRRRTEILRDINTRMEKAEVSAAESKINQVQSQLESTRILLDETTIRSPIDGIIATKNIEAGEMVREDSTIATVFDISGVYIVLNINEDVIHIIKEKQMISFTVDSISDKTYTAQITNISPYLDPKTRTVQIKGYLDNMNGILLPGMFARAQIHLGERSNVILISEDALLDYDRDKNTAYVYIVKDDTIFKETVKTGKIYDNKIEIENGLFPNDEVITKNIFSIYEGQKIEE